jgi:hypothetical protein
MAIASSTLPAVIACPDSQRAPAPRGYNIVKKKRVEECHIFDILHIKPIREHTLYLTKLGPRHGGKAIFVSDPHTWPVANSGLQTQASHNFSFQSEFRARFCYDGDTRPDPEKWPQILFVEQSFKRNLYDFCGIRVFDGHRIMPDNTMIPNLCRATYLRTCDLEIEYEDVELQIAAAGPESLAIRRVSQDTCDDQLSIQDQHQVG